VDIRIQSYGPSGRFYEPGFIDDPEVDGRDLDYLLGSGVAVIQPSPLKRKAEAKREAKAKTRPKRNSGTKMKRTGEAPKAAEHEHDRRNPFCAAHLDISSPSPSAALQSDPEDDMKVYRRTHGDGVRAHVRADRVMKKKKKK